MDDDIIYNDLDDDIIDDLIEKEKQETIAAYDKYEDNELYNDNGIRVSISMSYTDWVIITKKYVYYEYFNGHVDIYSGNNKSMSTDVSVISIDDLIEYTLNPLVVISANAEYFNSKIEKILKLKAFI